MRKKTTAEFVKEATEKHGGKYDYTNSVYVKIYDKISIICPIHGEFVQVAKNHLKGCGCKLCQTEKQKTTFLQKYGCHPNQTAVVQQKSKQTNLERYGVENPSQNLDIKEKKRNTNLKNCGAAHNWCAGERRNHRDSTMISKHGFKNSNYIKNPHMIDILPLLTHEHLYHEYIILGKTAIQISKELNINSTTAGRYLRSAEIKLRKGHQSYVSRVWLEQIQREEKIEMEYEYRFNPKRKHQRADGFCKTTNTIYEFHGDCWHGNPQIYKPTDTCHPKDKKITAIQLLNTTRDREEEIKELGYNLVVMWESDWNEMQKIKC